MEQIDNCLATSGKTYQDIERIGVSCGPGSFTGIRVGMATARGIGLGLNVPVAGVSCLDACEASALAAKSDGPLLSVLDAGRGEFFCKLSSGGAAWIASSEALHDEISGKSLALAGSGAEAIAQHLGNKLPIVHTNAVAPIGVYAELAGESQQNPPRAEPIYLRSADAKPQSGFVLEREAV